MKRIFTLALLAAIISVFGMSVSAQRTYLTSYYKGKLTVDLTSMGMAATDIDDQYISITPTTPGYCTVSMYNFNFGGQHIGDIVIDNAQLTDGEDGGFNISGSQENMSLADGTITADVTCQGTLDVNGNLDMNIEVTYSGVTIPVTFSGSYSDDYQGISDVATDTDADATYYTLGGIIMPSDALSPGIYIKRQGNIVTKVVMR